MPGRPGQRLTVKEHEEIEAYNAQGRQRPAKYNDAVYDSSTPGGAGYRWATTDEKRRADEDARQQAKEAANREKVMERVRDVAAGRAMTEATDEDEGSPFGAGTTESLAPFEITNVPPFAGVTSTTPSSAPEATGQPRPMPASLASALRAAKPATRSTKATSVEERAPTEAVPVVEATPTDEAKG